MTSPTATIRCIYLNNRRLKHFFAGHKRASEPSKQAQMNNTGLFTIFFVVIFLLQGLSIALEQQPIIGVAASVQERSGRIHHPHDHQKTIPASVAQDRMIAATSFTLHP